MHYRQSRNQHRGCSTCRLRFEMVAYGDDRCPECQGELEPAVASQLVGYRLRGSAELGSLARAVAAAAALPGGEQR